MCLLRIWLYSVKRGCSKMIEYHPVDDTSFLDDMARRGWYDMYDKKYAAMAWDVARRRNVTIPPKYEPRTGKKRARSSPAETPVEERGAKSRSQSSPAPALRRSKRRAAAPIRYRAGLTRKTAPLSLPPPPTTTTRNGASTIAAVTSTTAADATDATAATTTATKQRDDQFSPEAEAPVLRRQSKRHSVPPVRYRPGGK